MADKDKQILDIFSDLMVEDRQKAIELSTGLFVSSIIAHLETEGHVANKDIKIQGANGQRDITIHALNS